MRELENLKSLISSANQEELIEVLMNQESNFNHQVKTLVSTLSCSGIIIGEIFPLHFHPINIDGKLQHVATPLSKELKKFFLYTARKKWVSEMNAHFFELGFKCPDKTSTMAFNLLKGYVPDLKRFKETSIVFNKLVQDLQRQPEEWHLKKAGVKTRVNKAVIRCLRKLYS